MRITRKQLGKIIQKILTEQSSLQEEDDNPVSDPDIDFEIGLKDAPVSLKLRMNKAGDVEAYVKEDDTGNSLEKYSDPSDESTKQSLFGWLRIGLEDAKDKDTKLVITKAISRLLSGESEAEEDQLSNLEKYLADRHFASFAQSVRHNKKFLV